MEDEVRERRAGRDLVGQRQAVTEHGADHLGEDPVHFIDRAANDLHEPSRLAD